MIKTKYASIVKAILEDKGYPVFLTKDTKNNSAYISLTIRGGNKVSPVFNIGDNEEKTPEEFAQYVINNLETSIDVSRIEDIIRDKNEVLNRIIYILVNKKLNAKRKNIVRFPVCDTLEKHFKIDISDVFKDGMISVEQKHIENLGITLSELNEASDINTSKNMPAVLTDMSSFIDIPIETDLYVLTNNVKMYGAGVILYDGINDMLSDAVGEGFALIPSSVHEWIVVPSEFSDVDFLTKTIGEVNSTVLKPEEVLSDRPYKFDNGRFVEA